MARPPVSRVFRARYFVTRSADGASVQVYKHDRIPTGTILRNAQYVCVTGSGKIDLKPGQSSLQAFEDALTALAKDGFHVIREAVV